MSREPKRVYTVEHLELLDGTEVEVKPLSIKRLRKAQAGINKAMEGQDVLDDDGKPVLDKNGEPEKAYSDEAVFDAFFDVTELVMQGQKNCEKFLDPDDGRELLEDSVDQNTLYEIVKVSTGYDFLAVQERIQKIMEAQNLPTL